MNPQEIKRDERTIAVENASYRVAYMVISYGLLAIVTYRGFFLQQTNWDLMALVVLSGGIATFYQGRQKIFAPGWMRAMLVTMLAAAVLAVVIVLFLR